MDPVSNNWCNFTYVGLAPDIVDLPCRRETENNRPVVRAYFKPTPEELDEIVAGGTICLSVYTAQAIPAVSLGVVFTPEDLTSGA